MTFGFTLASAVPQNKNVLIITASSLIPICSLRFNPRPPSLGAHLPGFDPTMLIHILAEDLRVFRRDTF